MCDTIYEPKAERCGGASEGDVRDHGIVKSFIKEEGPKACLEEWWGWITS